MSFEELQTFVPTAGEIEMQAHVEDRELEVAHEMQAALEILRGEEPLEDRARHAGARIDMACHRLDHGPPPTENFHELARKLHGAPIHRREPPPPRPVRPGEELVPPRAQPRDKAYPH